MIKLTNNYWFLSILSGILLWLAWPPLYTSPLIFVGFLPLLWLQHKARQEGTKNIVLWFHTYVALLIWNALTTYWVWHASEIGAVFAITLNAVIMSLPWLFYHITRKTFGDKLAFPALVFYWLGFEYLHLNWQVAWPWLTVGNVFASTPNMVQWYEYTGFLGGSIWVLVVNILAYKLITNYTRANTIKLSAVVLVPIIVSYAILYNLDQADRVREQDRVNTSVIQPNIDPYTDKFGGRTPQEQLDVMLRLAEESITSKTRLVIFPETSLTHQIDESALNSHAAIVQIRNFCRKHKVSVLTGADTYYFFKEGEKLTPTARTYKDNLHYDAYNTALLIDTTNTVQVYHKSKLVPGVEQLPYPQVFRPLEKFFDLGGTSGSLGIQDDAAVLTTNDSIKIAPIICYESVFGDWVGSYVRQGADLLCIITNDGWWRNTPGYKQHLQYARLRAIEMRRNIARSANTGISAFINYKGEIEMETNWWVEAQINKTTSLKRKLTWYAKTGDYLGKLSAWLAVMILLATLVKARTKKGY